jgi:hypothetical protein
LKSKPHLKGVVASSDMYDSVVAMINIGKALIPSVGVIGIVHAQDVHDHPVDELGLAICLGVEGSGLGELGVQ